ncbi:hypothetical protein KKF60_01375 [Patescibacteria group bacterium]|nr:hypothetical protein [Patescibacteria group bacterium]MBU4458536.1 hypothetical protein [Patescibacteria group bacterium]
MEDFNLNKECKFISFEKSILNKKSLVFELLNIANVLLANYAEARKKKTKDFYKIIYSKTKNFYLKQIQVKQKTQK